MTWGRLSGLWSVHLQPGYVVNSFRDKFRRPVSFDVGNMLADEVCLVTILYFAHTK